MKEKSPIEWAIHVVKSLTAKEVKVGDKWENIEKLRDDAKDGDAFADMMIHKLDQLRNPVMVSMANFILENFNEDGSLKRLTSSTTAEKITNADDRSGSGMLEEDKGSSQKLKTLSPLVYDERLDIGCLSVPNTRVPEQH